MRIRSRRARLALAIFVLLTAPCVGAPAARAADDCCVPLQILDMAHASLSPDGRSLYTGDGQNLLAFRLGAAAASIAPVQTLRAEGWATVVDPAGTNLYTATRYGREIGRWSRDAATGRVTKTGSAYAEGAEQLAISPDGRFVYAIGGYNQTVQIFRPTAGGGLAAAGTTYVGNYPQAIAMSPDGTKLLAGNDVFARYSSNGSLGSPHPALEAMARVSFTADGAGLVSSSQFWPANPAGPPTATTWSDSCDGAAPVVIGSDVYGVGCGEIAHGRWDGAAVHQVGAYRDWEGGFRWLGELRALTASADGRVLAAAGFDYRYRAVVVLMSRDPATGALTPRARYRLDPAEGAAAADGPLRITIDDGAFATNDPHVKLEVRGLFPDASMLLLGNDSGTDALRRLTVSPDHVYSWTLDSSGPEALPKTVYASALGPVVHDSIVLDERPPTVTSARLTRRSRGRSTVRVAARDRITRVTRVQFARSRAHPGGWRAYSSRRAYSVAATSAWVRAEDRAGNRSRWRRAVRR